MKIALFLILFLIGGCPVIAQNSPPPQPIPDFKFSKISSSVNPDIKRSEIYDYQPSAMIEKDGSWTVWDCGQEGLGVGVDSVVRTKFNSLGVKTGDTTMVLRANYAGRGSGDSLHACAPTVVSHGYAGVNFDGYELKSSSDELYLMYYECGPVFFNKCDGSVASTNSGKETCDPEKVNVAGFAQICAAASRDGVNWHKYNETLLSSRGVHYGTVQDPPTPVIKVGAEVKLHCGFNYEDVGITGKYRAYLQNQACINDPVGNYGVSQPSAWTKVYPDGTKQVWLWYMETKGGISPTKKVMLAKSWDGIHFETAVKTNLWFNPEVRYYPGTIGKYTGVFIATATAGNNYLMYSTDGITWTQPLYEAAWWWALHIRQPNMTDADARTFAEQQIAGFAMGKAQNNLCTSPGSSGLLGDIHGNINSLNNVTLFSNEGSFGSGDNCTTTNGCTCYSSEEDLNRGRTWGIYAMKGNINFVAPTNTPTPILIAGDFDENGVVNLADFGVWKSKYLAGQMTLVEFGVWKREYLK